MSIKTTHAILATLWSVVDVLADTAGNGYTSPPTVTIDPPPASIEYTTFWSNDGTSIDGGEPVDAVSVPVDDGLFSVRLGDANLPNMLALDEGLFQQPDLELRIWFDDGVNGFAALDPAQPLSATPYALHAQSADEAQEAGVVDMGSITDPTFIGTTTGQPLEFFVNNLRALRFEDNGDSSDPGNEPDEAPNVIGGSSANLVGAGAVGATIAGGGAESYFGNPHPNTVFGDYSSIGGGRNNTIASNAAASTVSGGYDNEIGVGSGVSTIGGGRGNTIATLAPHSTVAGGISNDIGADSRCGAIGGGFDNKIADGSAYATIPGGRNNAVGTNADYAFAAGHRAKANHPGAFVWADSLNADLASTADDQFLVRAAGGVGINKDNPSTALDVDGTVTAGSFQGDGGNLTGISSLDALDGSPVNALFVDNAGNVGIGTTSPEQNLHIVHNSTPAIIDRVGSDGNLIRFRKDGAQEGSISVSGNTVSYNNFTGSHAASANQPVDRGMLVRLTGENQRLHGAPDAEIVYGIEPTQRANDPAVLGSFLGCTEPSEPFSLDNPHLVMAAGNGEVWVVDTGRDIVPGDYLIASDVRGHAMVDDRAEPQSHIIGRAGEGVQWSTVSETTDGVRHQKISILFGALVRDNQAAPERVAHLEARLAELEARVSTLSGIPVEMLATR